MHIGILASAIGALSIGACATVPGIDAAAAVSAAPPALPAPNRVPTQTVPTAGEDWVIAIHGGAGTIDRAKMTPKMQAAYHAALDASLAAGSAVLAAGGDGPAAIEAALMVLEDSPLFNAGRGAALDEHGNAVHDASIMRGDDRDAGAVAGSRRIMNPIAAARAVMERTENVMLAGDGADWFATSHGLDMANPIYFQTDRRRDALMAKRRRDLAQEAALADPSLLYGTVGAVVLDQNGTISAGTSTGGRTNKRFGRIGDSPVIGAGTYASNSSCAVSATGHGEYFMRWTVAREICARMELAGEDLATAAHHVVVDQLGTVGGGGAVIAMDPSGLVVFSMNESGMYRGVQSSSRAAQTAIWANETVK